MVNGYKSRVMLTKFSMILCFSVYLYHKIFFSPCQPSLFLYRNCYHIGFYNGESVSTRVIPIFIGLRIGAMGSLAIHPCSRMPF